MSKTDKTHPYWVQIRQNSKFQVESHDHRNGICDLEFRNRPFNAPYTCNYNVKYYTKTGRKIFGRASKAEQAYRDEANGSARMILRNTIDEIRKMSREDIEDFDILNPNHRHQALWDIQ